MPEERLPRQEWHTLILDAHPGYITWQDYEENLRRLQENAQIKGVEKRSAAREGPSLLQGLVICGICGSRMTVGYRQRKAGLAPDYICQGPREVDRIEKGYCQRISGYSLDLAIGALLVETVTPLALEVALSVQQEMQSRSDEADRLRRLQVDRARYESELARRRFLRVDPLCVLRVYVTSGCEMLCRRFFATVPGAHNYSDFRKAMRPAS